MSKQGAILQEQNNELVKCIEELRIKMGKLTKTIEEEEEERQLVEKEVKMLSERLHRIDTSVSQKLILRTEYQHMLDEAESAYAKIIESSQTLLQVLRKGSNSLNMDAQPRGPKPLLNQ